MATSHSERRNTSHRPVVIRSRQYPTLSDSEAKAITLFSKAEASFRVIGALQIILGFADLILCVIALLLGSTVAFSFSGLWAGCLPATVNGVLLIRCASIRPFLDSYFSQLVGRVGYFSFLMYFVDFVLAFASLLAYVPTDLTWNNTYYNRIYQSPATAESARVTVLIFLLIITYTQIGVTSDLNRHFAWQIMHERRTSSSHRRNNSRSVQSADERGAHNSTVQHS